MPTPIHTISGVEFIFMCFFLRDLPQCHHVPECSGHFPVVVKTGLTCLLAAGIQSPLKPKSWPELNPRNIRVVVTKEMFLFVKVSENFCDLWVQLNFFVPVLSLRDQAYF